MSGEDYPDLHAAREDLCAQARNALLCGCPKIHGAPTIAGFCTVHGAALPMLQALRAVLLFHDAGAWDKERAYRWTMLTGHDEATTRTLCDVVRAAIALAEAGQ